VTPAARLTPRPPWARVPLQVPDLLLDQLLEPRVALSLKIPHQD
jgi:hypothetical protein